MSVLLPRESVKRLLPTLKIKNGTQSKRCEIFIKIDRLLNKRFTQNFKERYHHKRRNQVSNMEKKLLPEEAPKEKSARDMNLYELFNFLKELSGLQKLRFPLEDYMDGYF